MNPKLAHLLVRLYPDSWRERYGVEFETHLQTGGGGLHASVNVVWSALHERIFPSRTKTNSTQGLSMNHCPNSVIALTKKPSAFVPLTMSLTALAVVLVHVAIYGVVREADEGTVAHIWQLLMAGQMPVLAFFLIKWLPRAPRQALYVLALQAGAVFASMAPVFFLKL
jgi:hypothetical protein